MKRIGLALLSASALWAGCAADASHGDGASQAADDALLPSSTDADAGVEPASPAVLFNEGDLNLLASVETESGTLRIVESSDGHLGYVETFDVDGTSALVGVHLANATPLEAFVALAQVSASDAPEPLQIAHEQVSGTREISDARIAEVVHAIQEQRTAQSRQKRIYYTTANINCWTYDVGALLAQLRPSPISVGYADSVRFTDKNWTFRSSGLLSKLDEPKCAGKANGDVCISDTWAVAGCSPNGWMRHQLGVSIGEYSPLELLTRANQVFLMTWIDSEGSAPIYYAGPHESDVWLQAAARIHYRRWY